MVRSAMEQTFIFVGLFLLVAPPHAESSQPIPSAFQQILIEQQCDSFDGFEELAWERGAVPYRFGILDNVPEQDSAAVWCHWRKGKEPKLLFWSADKAHVFPCGEQITSAVLSPGAITIRGDVSGETGYRYLVNPDVYLAEPLKPVGPSFSFSYEGLSTRLACHQGQWVFINFD